MAPATDAVGRRTFPLQGGLPASLAIGLGAVLAIEGAVLHLWIAARSEAWAWAITAINVVTLVWLWREYRAGTRSALSVDEQDIDVTIGRRMRCGFSHSNIASAALANWRSVPDLAPSDYINTAKPLEPNVMLVLKAPVDARLPFGIHKRYARIGVRVEDPDALLAALRTPREPAPRAALCVPNASDQTRN